jgi:hypothetical protein
LLLSHLCFADDLLIFSAATLKSALAIKAVLAEFDELSGLKVNPSKSSVLCSGVSLAEKELVVNCLNMKEATLSMRCLGIPLLSKKLSAADCGGLVEKVLAQINSWLSKKLSFADRLQLISSIMYSVQVYWSSVFILPKQIIGYWNKDLIDSFGLELIL